MYLITALPIHRKIPGKVLTYISQANFNVGDIITIEIKKKSELAIVTKSAPVVNEKSYIKSLSYNLVNLEKQTAIVSLSHNMYKILEDFSMYTLSDINTVLYNTLKSFKPTKKQYSSSLDRLLITSAKVPVNKKQPESKNVAQMSVNECISFLLINKSNTIKEIETQEPEKITQYSAYAFSYDLLVLLVMLSKSLHIKLVIKANSPRLRYREWQNTMCEIQENSLEQKSLYILDRSIETKEEKSQPLSLVVIEKLKDKYKNKTPQVAVLAFAQGFSTKTKCEDCGHIHSCSTCYKPLRLVKNTKIYATKYGIAGEYIYICTECKTASSSLVVCVICHSFHLRPLGYGNERIIECIKQSELGNVFDGTLRILKKDIATWQKFGGYLLVSKNTLEEIESMDTLLIPTLAPILYSDSFENKEDCLYILQHTAKTKDGTIVQILKEEEELFIKEDTVLWQQQEMELRKDFNYPPFARHIEIQGTLKSEKMMQTIAEIINQYSIKSTLHQTILPEGSFLIQASFNKKTWNMDSLDQAQKLNQILEPFKKYIQIIVY